jgi:hypothetical protein
VDVSELDADSAGLWVPQGDKQWGGPTAPQDVKAVGFSEVRIRDCLPSGYARYMRVFHPFVPWDNEESDSSLVPHKRWAELAEEAGATYRVELQWDSLKPALPILPGGGRGWAVSEGSLELITAQLLLAALSGVTDDQPAFFLYGLGAIIRVRRRLLFRAGVRDLAEVKRTASERDRGRSMPGPELIWPEDRGWVVLTDYDLVSTYLACGNEAFERVSAEPDLEVLEAKPETRVDAGADQINR